ncbi:uncharacterized protein LOC122030490 [Zingiber officinale]|uniref:GPI inositol-deacylase n=1 Tax=Zingiber officinale TaxID=94328 RepID=A0A8J5CD42_ZINOF|nr:uncharacterized protein LOC122030490 [Zingiber officinale]KAG6472322.1 hypothetical protein ZIOFF_069782 [Zingiber officinale]
MSALPTPHPLPLATNASSPAAARPAVILPGLGNNTADYKFLTLVLREAYGIPSVVAKVSRVDWLRNAAGLLSPNYWRGSLCPRPVLDWYLERVDEAVTEANELLADGGKISLIGHSAGGWLGRLYFEEFGTSNISLLLTLGTPHLPPPKGLPGVIDQTRGLLDYVNKNCAPAVYTPELKYVCIAGRYIEGARLIGTSNGASHNKISTGEDNSKAESITDNGNGKLPPAAPSLRARLIGQGYKQVCGKAEVWGDGVVPEVSAHLEGALNISLDGVYHSPFGSDDTLRPWYGSPSVLEKWVHHLT